MKKTIIIAWCVLSVFLAAACKNGWEIPSGTADTVASSATADTTASAQSTESTSTPEQEEPYKKIACATVSAFREVCFCVSNSRTQIYIMFPAHWTLEESDKGYNILQASKVIGSVTASAPVESEELETVYSRELAMSSVRITSRIHCAVSEGEEMYIRTISYRYKDAEDNSRTITVTMPYQQIDDDAVWKMMVKTKNYTNTDPKMGVLTLADNRRSILILGNSFVGTSRIGSIFQKMCGTSLQVEAQSRGYARVTTYVQDAYVMNRIRSGDYAAVILCGLYDSGSVASLEHMVNACASSDTKLALFPAHNENASMIATARAMYPAVTFLDWKGEIESLINKGIDQTHFCIADSHKHSTPLAGYVGAHMIYRAIFGKVPAETTYSEVPQQAIGLLVEYPLTGSVSFSKPNATYPLKAD